MFDAAVIRLSESGGSIAAATVESFCRWPSWVERDIDGCLSRTGHFVLEAGIPSANALLGGGLFVVDYDVWV